MAAAPSQDQTGAAERRAEPATAARAKALASADSADAAHIELGAMVEARLLPEEWLRRIIALRRAGRNGEADASLQRFMQRFPDLRVPDEARLAHP